MSYQPTNKEYEFSSVDDMLKFLTNDNVDLFLVDFSKMLKQAVAVQQFSKVVCELKGVEYTDDMVSVDSMTWIDDGKHDCKTGLRVKESGDCTHRTGLHAGCSVTEACV